MSQMLYIRFYISDIFNNHDLNNFYLNIQINNSKVSYNGGGNMLTLTPSLVVNNQILMKDLQML